MMIDLGRKMDINAIRIAWANPYARNYAVQFWTGELEPFYEGVTKGSWQTFPKGLRRGWQRRNGDAEGGGLENSRAIPPHLDDEVLQHLRHPRFRGQAQLRRLCDQ